MGKHETRMEKSLSGDERRRDFRADVPMCLSVDMPLALSYDFVDAADIPKVSWQWDELAISPDLIKTMIAQTDLTTQEPLLLQLLVRIDWMLTSVLKSLGKDKKLHQALPEFVIANISGSGIRFPSSQEFQVGQNLVLRIALRPFVPIQAVGKVVWIRSIEGFEEARFETACEFVSISSDDREAIIRHVLRSQAVLQRRRNTQSADVLVP